MFLFCTSEINETNISAKHLSKPKPALLLNLIDQLNNYFNEQNNENNQNMLDCKHRNVEYLYENCLTKLSHFDVFISIFDI